MTSKIVPQKVNRQWVALLFYYVNNTNATDLLFYFFYNNLLKTFLFFLISNTQSKVNRRILLFSKFWEYSGIEQRCLTDSAFPVKCYKDVTHNQLGYIVALIIPTTKKHLSSCCFRVIIRR